MKKVMMFIVAAALAVPAVFAQNDSETQASVQKALSASRFKGIQASVQGGVVTLTGTVDVFAKKMDADQKAHHVHGITAVRNRHPGRRRRDVGPAAAAEAAEGNHV